jgi:hypothetical protein
MATEKNLKDMEQRKIHYDQISFLFAKGGRRLLRAMGVKERCSAADVIRRAILARAGLERVPDKCNLDKLDATETPREAVDALIDCQSVEYVKRELRRQGRQIPGEQTTAVMVSSQWYKDESLAALEAARAEVEKQNQRDRPRMIELSRQDYDALCRLLANTLVIDDDNM